jgi:broad specificity phosphatase PhoE
MRYFYFLRHGQTEFNKNNLWTGSSDVHLNAEGRREIYSSLSTHLDKLHIDFIFSSPLLRAIQSAEIVNEKFQAKLAIIEGFAERSFGAFEGTPKTESSREMLDYSDSVEKNPIFLKRISDALLSVPLDHNVLIVSHSGVFKGLRELGFIAKKDTINNGEVVKLVCPSTWR